MIKNFIIDEIHNPTGSDVAFVLPILNAGRQDNHRYLQVVSPNGRVVEVDVLDKNFQTEIIKGGATVSIGDPAVYAFAHKGSVVLGTKKDIASSLIDIANNDLIGAYPLMALSVYRFSDRIDLAIKAVSESYAFLSAVSDYSAKSWRDRRLIPSVVSHIIREYLENSGRNWTQFDEQLDEVFFSIKGGRPILTLTRPLMTELTGGPLESRVRDGLRPFISPFVSEGRDVEFDLLADEPGIRKGPAPGAVASWLAVSSGATSRRALNGLIESRPNYSKQIVIDLDAPSTSAFLTDYNLWGNRPVDENTTMFVCYEPNAKEIQRAFELATELRKVFRVEGVALLDAEGEAPRGGVSAGAQGEFAHVTAIPLSKISLGRSTKDRRPADCLVAFFDRVERRSFTRSLDGLSIFGLGAKRGGSEPVIHALREAVAGLANPYVSLRPWSDLDVTVIAPTSESSEVVEPELASLFARASGLGERVTITREEYFRLDHRPGLTECVLIGPAEDAMAVRLSAIRQSAVTTLKCAGFEVFEDDGEIAATSGSGAMRLSVGETSYASFDKAEAVSGVIVETRAVQREIANRATSLEAPPLLLSDLWYLKEVVDLKWALPFLATFSLAPTMWSDTQKAFLLSKVIEAISRGRSRYTHLPEVDAGSVGNVMDQMNVRLSSFMKRPGRRLIVANYDRRYDKLGFGPAKASEVRAFPPKSIFQVELSPMGSRVLFD